MGEGCFCWWEVGAGCKMEGMMLGRREDRAGFGAGSVRNRSLGLSVCLSVCAMLIDRSEEAIILDLPLLDRWSR
jgi:hypothetical protein